ncbi:MAG: response regulator transcription factor [Bacteroidetes bacterium]|nr:response regulator transcription factor [Bacteroidota bacterium]
MNASFLIADDHVIVRRGLRNLLHDQYHASDISEVATCKELLAVLNARSFTLLLLDLQLTDGSTLDHLGKICEEHPEMKVLVYTMRSEEVYAQRVLALGGAGYLSKESNEEEVVRAIRQVLQGKEYVSTSIEDHLQEKDESAKNNPLHLLSDRELGVMDDLLAGLGVKEISLRLGLQPSTVATYKARLFDKLGVTNLLDLQRLAKAHRHHAE